MINLTFQQREGYVQVGELNGLPVYAPPQPEGSNMQGAAPGTQIRGATQPSLPPSNTTRAA